MAAVQNDHNLNIEDPFDNFDENDRISVRTKVFECREINIGGGIRTLELALQSSSIEFSELLKSIEVTLRLKLTKHELSALISEFECIQNFKKGGKSSHRIILKKFILSPSEP